MNILKIYNPFSSEWVNRKYRSWLEHFISADSEFKSQPKIKLLYFLGMQKSSCNCDWHQCLISIQERMKYVLTHIWLERFNTSYKRKCKTKLKWKEMLLCTAVHIKVQRIAKNLWNKLVETDEFAENNLSKNGKSQKEKVNINCKKDMMFIWKGCWCLAR